MSKKQGRKPTGAFYVLPENHPTEPGKVIDGDVVRATRGYADVKWRESDRVERVRFGAEFGIRFTYADVVNPTEAVLAS